MNFLVLHENPAGGQVDLEITTSKGGGLLLRADARNVAKCHSNACQKFARAERLGQVIIRPVVQGGDLLLFLIADGKNDDWGLEPFAQLPENFLTVLVW